MKRAFRLTGVFLAALLILFGGCSQESKEEHDGKETAYTVVDPDEVPGELKEIIEKNKENEIKMSYLDGGILYAVRGYGSQRTGGYSIQVNSVSQKEGEIYVNTSLIGPSADKEIQEEPSYPYLVLNLGKTEGQVVFD